uniref:GATA-type domain-containing protein n=1 Tax=Vannella robusta TaxID=1487602 RepID=A0A7S4MN26_9EUKA|mmetsp:Transcript_4059/g.5033  ORF Transcript_4059/g.5033 Transcript_4059/m.5033 type:complete len:225 (+) Transcript_4059:175-849(+)
MPQCAQCQTSDTPCWREGPQGARTLCNACGIRWKRLLGRNKRSTKRSSTPKSKPAKKKQQPQPQQPQPQPAKVETPIQKAQQQPIAARTTRSSTRSTRKLLDHSTLASKNVLTMSQNELLDCILTRLEDLESSQTRTSLRVRVLTQRLMRQKQKQNSIGSGSRARAHRPTFTSDSNKFHNTSTLPRQEVEMTEGGDGEAALLASMREGTSISLPVEFNTLHAFS